MTPRELTREQEAARRRSQHELEREVALAWHTANFTAAARVGKLKNLKSYLDRLRTPSGGQSYQEMKENLEVISRLAGIPMREVMH
jgi:hypothetical protein